MEMTSATSVGSPIIPPCYHCDTYKQYERESMPLGFASAMSRIFGDALEYLHIEKSSIKYFAPKTIVALSSYGLVVTGALVIKSSLDLLFPQISSIALVVMGISIAWETVNLVKELSRDVNRLRSHS